MQNELLLLGSVVLIYGAVLLAYRLFGTIGLYVMTAITTVLANIEVLMLIDGFGMEQTLGNVMFASTYLITDILSENEGKKCASRAVWIGVFSSLIMLLFTQYWLWYIPASTDWASAHIHTIFSTTPRMLIASFAAYILSQWFDVWFYHRLWDFTTKKIGNRSRLLWFRNNCATLIAQILNTAIFTLFAFAGWYDGKSLLSIMLSSFLVFIATSLLDTPAVYFARRMKQKGWVQE